MSTQEHIFLDSALSSSALAEWFAPLLGMRLSRGPLGEVYLSRPAHSGEGDVGGEIYPNYLADPDSAGEEESLLDGFSSVFDVGYTGRDDAVQLREAKALFADLGAKVSMTMVLVHGFDILVAVSTPRAGVLWMPPRTTPDFRDRDAWLPYRAAG